MHKLLRLVSLLPPIVALACDDVLPVDPADHHAIPEFSVPAVEPGVAYERFMVIGDMGTGGAGQRAIAAAMRDRARKDGLDFIITTGDNIYPNGVSSAADAQWKTKFEDIYSDEALQVPIFPSLGNHDHHGSVDAQVAYSKRNNNWRMPARYYTTTRTLGDGTTVGIFVLDTTPIAMWKPESDAQLEWLDQEMGKSAARWKIVVGHHPLYAHGVHGRSAVMIDRVESLLVKHRADVYVAGHDHVIEMLKPVRGVYHVVSGGGGGMDNPYPARWSDDALYIGTRGGFTFFRVSEREIVIEFVRVNAKTQYAYIVRK